MCYIITKDGTGYPVGLKGEKIPLVSRIIAVADAYEEMTSERSDKKARTRQEAFEELKIGMGKKYDPVIVEIFEKIINSVK